MMLLLRQLAQHPPHPAVHAVVKLGRLGEHQDALTGHHADAVLLAEADGVRRFGTLLHPHPRNPYLSRLAQHLLRLGRGHHKHHAIHRLRQRAQIMEPRSDGFPRGNPLGCQFIVSSLLMARWFEVEHRPGPNRSLLFWTGLHYPAPATPNIPATTSLGKCSQADLRVASTGPPPCGRESDSKGDRQ